MQFYCQSFPRPHVSIFIGRICSIYLYIEIQVPDHVRKRRDQWQVHQSQNWPSDLFSNICGFAYSNWDYYCRKFVLDAKEKTAGLLLPLDGQDRMPSPLLRNSTFLLEFLRPTTIVMTMVMARDARCSTLNRLVSGF